MPHNVDILDDLAGQPSGHGRDFWRTLLERDAARHVRGMETPEPVPPPRQETATEAFARITEGMNRARRATRVSRPANPTPVEGVDYSIRIRAAGSTTWASTPQTDNWLSLEPSATMTPCATVDNQTAMSGGHFVVGEATEPVTAAPTARWVIPNVMLFNASLYRQRRWVDFALPWGLSESMPNQIWLMGCPSNFYAVKAHAVGRHSRIWSVYADLGPRVRWMCRNAAPAQEMSGSVHPLVVAGLANADLLVWLEWLKASVEQPQACAPSFRSSIRDVSVESAHLTRITFKDTRRGFHLTGEIRLRSFQPVADFDLSVVWSDPTSPELYLRDFLPVIESRGCALHIDFKDLRGFHNIDFTGNKFSSNCRLKAVDGCGFRVTGTLIFNPTQDLGEAQEAAASGKILSSCEWDSDFMALGVTRTEGFSMPTEAALGAKWDAINTAPQGSLYDPRRYSNAPFAGQPGDQEPFGAQKGTLLLTDPVEAALVNVSCDDLLMRGFHHRESDGHRVMFRDHPEWRTFEGVTHYATSADTLGKTRPATNDLWYQLGEGRIAFLDDQHRGDKYLLACYAMTGSYVLLDSILDLIETDKARAFRRTGQLDAPRATGRLWQSWADMAMVLPVNSAAKQEVFTLAMEELAKLEAHDVSMGDRVPWMWSVRSPNYLNNEFDVAFPWQETLAVLGAEAMCCALHVHGRTDDFARMWRWAKKHAVKLMRYGIVRDNAGNREHPVMAAIYDSSLWPADYIQADRQGVAFETAPGVNLQIGTDGWFDWFSSIIVLCKAWLEPGPNDENVDIIRRARELYARFGHYGVKDPPLHSFEWWTIPGGSS